MPLRSEIKDLAFFTGKPLFPEPLHVGRPNLGNRKRFLNRINDMLDRAWLTNNGRYVKELEARVAEYLGVKHCVAMCNGTIALEIAVRALGMRGEVIVPSFTFIATAHCLQWQEITPVFCDIDQESRTISPEEIEKLITPRTTGILGVHLYGRPCHIEDLERIARKHKLHLLFDAAHAFGCSHNNKMIGGFGAAEVLSFHATKFMNALEGGAVVTNDDDLAQRVRDMKNFGFRGMDNVLHLGINGKMNEASAAMGLTNLESLDEFIECNRSNYHEYRRGLEQIPGIELRVFKESEKNNFQYIVIEIEEPIAGLSRDNLMTVLRAENILARRYFYPGCHRMEPYRSLFPNARLGLGETEKAAQRVLCLPTGTAVSNDDVREICRVIRLAVENAAALQPRLAAVKT